MHAWRYRRVAVALLLLAASSLAEPGGTATPPTWPPALQQALGQDVGATRDIAGDSTRLRAFFRRHATALDLFCANDCTDLESRQRQLQRYFRGSYAALPDDTADSSGKSTFAEVYAAHAAAYFTDASYRCRHPLTAARLESAWQITTPPPTCASRVPFMVMDEEGRNELRWIDPARVHAIHLVFAGASGATLSRFGHVGLRLVLCGEHRPRVDADCEEDLYDHLSLSFMASIDELELSAWKGITGGYPLKLHARQFISVYRGYTIDEFRALHSLPLHLEPAARELMIRALAQVHWSYHNDYRFFTRNCATELQWLLQVVHEIANPRSRPMLEAKRYRPDRLFGDARKSPHFDGALLVQPSEAERGGYLFPGAGAYYQVAVNVFRDHPGLALHARPRTPEDWRLRPALSRREYILAPALQQLAENPNAGKNAALTTQAALVLEAWVARRLRREILATMTSHYGSLLQSLFDNDAFFTSEERLLVAGCMELMKAADRTGTLAAGVPQEAFPSASDGTACDPGDPRLAALIKRLYETFPLAPGHRQQVRELEDTHENIRFLAQHQAPP